ncbi:hypothetical protein BC834DRAFT_569124 [Gloeopeniophorella convolvens]|nr:hypothetical protein BC834DRAFT_569124 [Gloeopeniophorella convolvens]
MLAPYSDRLRPAARSSQSTDDLTKSSHASSPYLSSASLTPSSDTDSSRGQRNAPSSILRPSSSSRRPSHNFSLPRKRTNSLSSTSRPHHSDSPSVTHGSHTPPRPTRNPARHLQPTSRSSLPSDPQDPKYPPWVPIVVTSPFAAASPLPPFADFIPMRRKSVKKTAPARKDNVPSPQPTSMPLPAGPHAASTTRNVAHFSTADRAILKELKLGAAARDSQFKVKGNKKHHAYSTKEAPYPRNYERVVIDHDVWETGFVKQLSGSQTFHVFKTPPSKVLDLACGSGMWILECAKVWRNCEFVGLDLVPLHPDLSHLRSSDLGSRITWVQANCLEGLPFPNEEFDFVHIKRIAHGIPEDKWDFLLEEISRVMKPGAAIEMIEEDLFFPGISPDSPPPTRSTTPVPYSTTPPSSSSHLSHGVYHSTNGQRRLSHNGLATATTAFDSIIYSPMVPGMAVAAAMSTLPVPIHIGDSTSSMGGSSALSDSSRSVSSVPMNPRDHSLLEYIYTEMHAARFINLSPLSLLANSLPIYFNNLRTHAPLMFMFPPLNLAEIKRQPWGPSDETSDSETELNSGYNVPVVPRLRPPPERPAKTATFVKGSTPYRHKDHANMGSAATLIDGRELLHHTQQYVVLDETAIAPGTVTARQKASTSTVNLPNTVAKPGRTARRSLPSTSSVLSSDMSLWSGECSMGTVHTAFSHALAEDLNVASRLNTLPNQRLKFDLQSLNLHLSTRVTEIVACAEAMWDWVCSYQELHARRSQQKGQGEHAHSRSTAPSTHSGEKDKANFHAELVGMSRVEFDDLLTRFELDMSDCIDMKSRITSAFLSPAPKLARTSNRKAFDDACEKWEEYQAEKRARRKTRAVGLPLKSAGLSSAELSDVEDGDDDGEDVGPRKQRLSRTFRVFCAWKAY